MLLQRLDHWSRVHGRRADVAAPGTCRPRSARAVRVDLGTEQIVGTAAELTDVGMRSLATVDARRGDGSPATVTSDATRASSPSRPPTSSHLRPATEARHRQAKVRARVRDRGRGRAGRRTRRRPPSSADPAPRRAGDRRPTRMACTSRVDDVRKASSASASAVEREVDLVDVDQLEQQLAGDAGQAPGRQGRGAEPTVDADEDVGAGALAEPPGGVGEDGLGGAAVGARGRGPPRSRRRTSSSCRRRRCARCGARAR